jgi:ketosteroid isomerase-like protein
MSAENLELVREIYERWAQGDFKTEATYSEEMELELGPEFPDAGVHSGLEGIAAYMRGFLQPWSRITIAAEELTERENRVLARVLQEGVGESSGIAVELRYFQLWTFDGAKPVRLESIKEETAAHSQLESG